MLFLLFCRSPLFRHTRNGGHWQNRRGNFIQQHLPSDTFDLSWISIFGNDRVRVHCIYSDDVSFKQNKSKTKYKTKRNKNK
jgi:hypothetical protein